jgi:hypothetical protein
MTVMPISVGEKVAETIRAQPRKKNQIAVISISQKTKHGNAAHLTQ